MSGGDSAVRQDPAVTEIPLTGEQCAAQSFRLTMSAFPSAVSVVTALDDDGLPRGLTCSAICSLSMDPPSILICVNRGNRSLDAIRHSGGFVVNLLREGRNSISDVFASPSPHKFSGVRWVRSPASGLPLLSGDALAYVDCRLVAELAAGSHMIIIGMVRESAAMPSVDGPLVYWQRTYGGWAPQGREADSRFPVPHLREETA